MNPTSNQPRIPDGRDNPTDTAGTSLGELAVEKLINEIQRYLEVVEVFRAEGCEPRWA
jgi:hypothetical protein